jgi:chloramphenicol-sensitive protein RarD
VLYGLAAYGWWGLMPLYFKAVGAVKPAELLAHRIVWSLVLLAAALTLWRRWPHLRRCLGDRRVRLLLCFSAVLVGVNWLVYIHGVASQRIVQTSLGYFINPLLSILLGLAFFRERLRAWQWVAVVLAAAGVAWHLWGVGELPWIALTVAGSWALYGLVRKVAPVDALVGLTVETLVLVVPALGFLAWDGWRQTNAFGRGGWQTDALVLASGVVTAVPLLCFGAAARRLRLSTLGFLQYLAPSMQLALGVLLYGEAFGTERAVSFGLIWSGLAVLTVESILVRRRRAAADRTPRANVPDSLSGLPLERAPGWSAVPPGDTEWIRPQVDGLHPSRPFLPDANR